jgi:hypothetical protein
VRSVTFPLPMQNEIDSQLRGCGVPCEICLSLEIESSMAMKMQQHWLVAI